MKEASCRVLVEIFKAARRRGLDPAALTAGQPYTLDHLQNTYERIDWSAFCQIMTNAQQHWSEDELEKIGAESLNSPFLRTVVLFAKLVYNPKDFYTWMHSTDKGAHRLLTCIRNTVREISPGRIQIKMELQRGFAPCRAFFVYAKGSFAELPRLFGGPRAGVQMYVLEEGAVFNVLVPSREALFGKIKKFLTWPITARLAARELKSTHEVLNQRYEQLEIARHAIDQQATQLRTAYRISQVVHGSLDLERVLQAVIRSLIEEAAFTRAVLVVDADVEGRPVRRRISSSDEVDDENPWLVLPLEVRDRNLGELRLWSHLESNGAAQSDLLEYVVPMIAMAIDESLTFTAVSDYRLSLEQKVAERTAELSATTQELANTIEQLKTAQAARDRLFANINHELRTPLSLIQLAADSIQLREEASISPASSQELASIEVSVGRLLRLIDELLLLAASREGKLKLQVLPCDVSMLLRQVTSTWQPAAAMQDLKLAYEGPTSCIARVDAGALERIITNLLSNAIKFTPPGGTINVSLSVSEANFKIRVADSGIGIDEDFKRRIFGRFEQGRSPAQPVGQGSGIGLSLVKELAEAHGGSVSLEANDPKGTIFYVELPNHRVPEAERALMPLRSMFQVNLAPTDYAIHDRSGDRGPAVIEAKKTSRGTILVAEDEPQLRYALGEILSEDYRVILACDGEQALGLARKHLPDLLISDVGMPKMSGLELTRQFRDMPGNRLAPVILLTAYTALNDKLRGFDAGAIDYLLKPFEPEDLKARVRSQLILRDLALKLHEVEKLAGLGVLAAGLAHEMRNPANALVNAVEPLKMLLPKDLLAPAHPVAQLLSVLETSGSQIAHLSKQLLGFRNVSSNGFAPEPLPLVLSRSVIMVQPKLEPVKFINICEYDGTIWCSPHMIMQVVSNLLDNAAFAAGPGGWVRMAARREGDQVIIEVSDSGPGVPRELRERIFEPFFTTKAPGQGTGLGLPVARDIVNKHRGTLKVQECPTGTLFSLTLPINPPQTQTPVLSTIPEARSRLS